MKADKYLHVAVGVIRDSAGNILISLRHDAAHQGGLWEFPGGKVEAGESVEQALKRELKEELDISITELTPLIQIKHQYTDLNVLLDVWTVKRFKGEAKGCEGQAIKWLGCEQLQHFSFPEANKPIISAVSLPTEYAILNGCEQGDLLHDLEQILNKGIKLIQARIKLLAATDVSEFIQMAQPLCKAKGATLLINSAVETSCQLKVDGIHFTSQDLLALKKRPEAYRWLAASCHNLQQLKHAEKIGLDFVVISPVLPTQTHSDAMPLGWDRFAQLTAEVNLPVYALGGMQTKYQKRVKSLGGQGIAGIRCFLSEHS